MQLQQNAFFILGVSCRDNQDTIAESFEDKILDGAMDEQVLMQAQKSLLTSKERLIQELSWVIEVSPSKSKQISHAIAHKQYDILTEYLSELQGLSKANICSFLCCNHAHNDHIIQHMFDAYAELHIPSLINDINNNRTISGFPKIESDLFNDSFVSIQHTHAQSVLQGIIDSAHPGDAFTTIIEQYLDDTDLMPFIDMVAEKYDVWVIPTLRQFEDDIEQHIQDIESGNVLNQTKVDNIIRLLEQWDAYSQPLQLISQQKELDEKRSKDLFYKIRKVCFNLHKKDQNDLALKLTRCLQNIFPELPFVSAEIDDDVSALEQIVQQDKRRDENTTALRNLLTLKDTIKKADTRARFVQSVLNGNFCATGTGIAGDAYRNFIKSIKIFEQNNDDTEPMFIFICNIGAELIEHGNHTAVEKMFRQILADTDPPTEAYNIMRNFLNRVSQVNKVSQNHTESKSDGIGFLGWFFIIIIIIALLSSVGG